MPKCSRCLQKKAKRRCPALRSDLCALCCGTLRRREVACPSTCRFLSGNEPYQKQKTQTRKPSAERAEAGRDDLLRDERMAWLALHAEAPLDELSHRSAEVTDGDAIRALEYARQKLEKERSLVILPGEEMRRRDEAGEAVFRSVEDCTYERSVILTGDRSSYTREEKIRVLDTIIQSARTIAGDNDQGRAYLERLHAQFAKISELSQKTRLIPPR